MFRFHKRYFIYAVLLFLTEVCIALFVQDKLIRPYLGDLIVVILIYYFLRAFLSVKPGLLATGTLLFAYLVEISQHFKMIEVLELQENRAAKIILGSAFSWADMVMYTLGILFIYWWDKER